MQKQNSKTVIKSRLAKYYNVRVASIDNGAFLKQVGHTEQGTAISEDQFECMVGQICKLLELGPDDDLLDLCCGNGVITHHMAKIVRSAVGIDFSSSLIEVAEANHHSANLQYQVLDARKLGQIGNRENGKFTKVLMHGALNHFNEVDFEQLLNRVMGISQSNFIFLVGFVPEKGKKRVFYDTPKRKLDYLIRRATGREVIGTWWDKKFIQQACKNLGLQCTFHDIDQCLSASRYRFDVKICNAK